MNAREIFERAKELPASTRSVFLDEQCKFDPEMRIEVERLLHLWQAKQFFEEIVHLDWWQQERALSKCDCAELRREVEWMLHCRVERMRRREEEQTRDAESAREGIDALFGEIRQLGPDPLRQPTSGQKLQPTTLVHEAYMRLVGEGKPGWQGRLFGAAAEEMRFIIARHWVEQCVRWNRERHREAEAEASAGLPRWLRQQQRRKYYGEAAQALRDLIVERARREKALERGRVGLDNPEMQIGAPTREVLDTLAIDDALEPLEAEDPSKKAIANLRFFTGFTEQETAEILGVSVKTVEGEWRYIRTWLYDQLSNERSLGSTGVAS